MRARWTNVVALLAAPACLAALAPWCGSWHWSIDLLACFPVQALGTLTVAAIALAIARKLVPAAILLLFAAIAAGATIPGWWSAPGTPRGDSPDTVENDPRIAVLALNLLRSNDDGHEDLLAVIHERRPDVIFCGEYTPGWQRFLAAHLPELPHRHERSDPGYFGTAVFSRWPLRDVQLVPLAESWTPAVRATIGTPFGPLGVLGVHPPPPGPSALRVGLRDRGLAAIAAALDGLPERRIVLGDCNATPWNHAFVRMLRAADLAAGTTCDWLPTWPAQLPWPLRIPIDHVLVGGALAVESAVVGPGFGSDHLPLAAVIRWR